MLTNISIQPSNACTAGAMALLVGFGGAHAFPNQAETARVFPTYRTSISEGSRAGENVIIDSAAGMDEFREQLNACYERLAQRQVSLDAELAACLASDPWALYEEN